MSANSFAFPPPPPPPPQNAYAQVASGSSGFSRGRGDKRWERGSRGRGRGHNHRGSRGGGHIDIRDTVHAASYATSNETQYDGGKYPLPNYPSAQHAQYLADIRSTYSNPPPPYASVAPQSHHQPTYPFHHPSYPNPQPHGASYAFNPHVYNPHAPQQQPHQSLYATAQHSSHRYASPPVAMGPPLRLGFGDQSDTNLKLLPLNDHDRASANYEHYSSGSTSTYRQGSSYDSQRDRHRSSNQQRRGRGSFPGRGRADTTRSSHESFRRTQVAPAVPSFGNPLPTKPPALQEESKKPKKKKRRVNQLGLTPKAEEHLSSSEDEDSDEELKLASTVATSGTPGHELKFTYKGQTSVLQSSNDIASWIEERRRNFPTLARKAENDAHLRKLKEERDALKAKKLLERQLKTLEKDKKAAEQAAAEKSKLKVEKLRRKLEKEERRAAKAEAKTLKRSAPQEANEAHTHEAKRMRYHSSPEAKTVEDRCQEAVKAEATESHDQERQSGSSIAVGPLPRVETDHSFKGSQPTLNSMEEEKQEPQSSVPDPLTPTSQPAVPDKDDDPSSKPESTVVDVSATSHKPFDNPTSGSHGVPDAHAPTRQEDLDSSIASSSSDTAEHSDESSDDEEETTSSGSSSSSTSESDSEGPETKSSRRARPLKVLAPKKSNNKDKAICRDFLRSGRCRRGKRCRWRHALPDRGQKKAEKSVLSKPERKSLHQRLVEQEQEKARAEGATSNEQEHGITHDTQVKAV